MLLNTATSVHVGSARATACYLDGARVWPRTPTFVHWETVNEDGTQTDLTVLKPPAVQPGDVGVFQYSADSSVDFARANADWTALATIPASNLQARVLVRQVQSGDPASWAFPRTGGGGDQNHRGVVSWWRGVTQWEIGAPGTRPGTQFTVTVPALSASDTDKMLLVCGDRTIGTHTDIPTAPGLTYLGHCQGTQSDIVTAGISSPAFLTGQGTQPATVATWPKDSGNAYGVFLRLGA